MGSMGARPWSFDYGLRGYLLGSDDGGTMPFKRM